MEQEVIRLWTIEDIGDTRSALPSSPHVAEIACGTLTKNLQTFLNTLKQGLSQLEFSHSNYAIEKLELNLAVNAQGGIELIGKLSAGTTASIRLTPCRIRHNE